MTNQPERDDVGFAAKHCTLQAKPVLFLNF